MQGTQDDKEDSLPTLDQTALSSRQPKSYSQEQKLVQSVSVEGKPEASQKSLQASDNETVNDSQTESDKASKSESPPEPGNATKKDPPPEPGKTIMKDPPPEADGTNFPREIPKEYLRSWVVRQNNFKKKSEELVALFNFLKSCPFSELKTKPDSYTDHFMVLSIAVFRTYVPAAKHRNHFVMSLLNLGIANFLKDLWSGIVEEFEKNRAAYDSSKSANELWDLFKNSPDEKYLLSAVTNFYRASVVIWNGTDLRDNEIQVRCYEIVPYYLNILDSWYVFPVENPTGPSFFIVKAILGTFHNFCHNYDEKRDEMRQMGAANIVSKHLNVESDKLLAIRIKAALVLAYLISEDDKKDKISLQEKEISFLVKALKNAMKDRKYHSRIYGYHADELFHGLNEIAVADGNKRKLVDVGILPICVQALKSNNTSLQSDASQCLWTLAFEDYSRLKIVEEPDCMDELKKLSKSDDATVRKFANGALWQIEGEREHTHKIQASAAGPNVGSQHVMISYQWDVKTEVLKVRERLRQAGFRVWIDVEQMGGSTLESMAKAVEDAAVFVPVLTEKYKASPACRQEAAYANSLQKTMVPIRLQPKYRPDGWLGFLLGSTFFYDLTKPNEYETKVTEFIRVLEDTMMTSGEAQGPERVEIVHEPTVSVTDGKDTQITPTIRSNLPLQVNDAKEIMKLKFYQWNRDDVAKWLQENGLEKLISVLQNADGKLLVELAAMQLSSPDVYYSCLREDYNLSLIELLKLNSALRHLTS